jgi:hypothetical protein
MDTSDEQKKKEKINFAMQGSSENAQFSIAVAVGIFGILVMFVTINDHGNENQADPFFKNALWTKSSWIRTAGIILSIAYWALVLFGAQSYVTRRMFEALMGDYLRNTHNDWYTDITVIAEEKKLTSWMVRNIWSNNYRKKGRYKGMYIVMGVYLGICFILWLIIGIL